VTLQKFCTSKVTTYWTGLLDCNLIESEGGDRVLHKHNYCRENVRESSAVTNES